MGSMGGVIDIRFGNSSALSPHKSSNLEKTQAELRQTFIAAERFRRELEFLQKGGDPLDLTTGETTSVSVQTSLTDHDPDEAKGSFAVTRDSNADNLMLFNGFNNDREVERRSLHPPANNCYSKLYSGQIIREVGIEFPQKSYKRRFRSQNARLSSSDASQTPKSINCNATTEQNLASDEALPSKEVNINSVIKKDNNSLDSCHSIHKEKDLEGSGSTWQFACAQSNIDLVNKEHEDFILKEAKIIEAKLKRIDELSGTTLALDTHRNSHWGFVLEEMSWLANDFAQERLWKLTLAGQVSRRASLASKVRYQQKVAQTLSRAVMEFWHAIQVKHKEVKHGLQGYAIRFLEYNSKKFQYSEAQVPMVPDMMSDEGIIDFSHEENLFYTVPHGATEAYRKSIESHLEAKATKKRRNKNNFKFDNGKSYETEAEEEDIEKNNGRQSQHVRIVSRQRVVGPFNGDTNSFQDEMEAESAGDYEKGSDRPRKKKRPNYRMRNMSDPKFIELLDKKSKSFKMSGSGTLWSLFEDQSLVVLVHDMGPNWGLISDAINSSFLFKCIFRGSKECKNRHKMLIVGDSDEDSGSFQPYPSTLPGIPEGRARHLFQHLQGPEEEDTLKSHFEKIIIIGQKQYYQRTQNDNQETEELQQTHISHTLSLSKVSPHNLNGGPVLTPLDLCDETESTPDVPMIPGSISSSSNLGHGNDLYKDRGRVTPMDDQHYKKMLSGTNLQDSNFARGPGTANGPVNHEMWFFKERQRMLQRQQFAQPRPVSSPQKSREIAQNGQKHPTHGVVQTGGTQILKQNQKLVNLSQRIVKSSEPPTTKVQGEQVSQPQTVNQSMVHRQSGHDVGC